MAIGPGATGGSSARVLRTGASVAPLPPAVVELAAARVGWLALGGALATSALTLAQAGAGAPVAAVTRLVVLAAVLAAGGLVVVARRRLAAPSVTLRAGMGLQVVVAFALAFLETATPAGAPHVGVSAIGPWILVGALSVPNRAQWTLRVGIAAAAAWPLAYAINAARGLAPAPSLPLALWPLVNVGAALAAARLTPSQPGATTSDDEAEFGGYHLETRIGEGGMGEVWRARHRLLPRDAAVKIIRSEMVDHVGRDVDLAFARFRREATAISRLQSPHTVALYDFGVAANGHFYLAMELLDGISLHALVRRFGPLPPGRAVHVLLQMCASLAEAHARGLVHRDIKPSNVMVCEVALAYDFVKVLDFGLVKPVADTLTTQLTLAGATTGTPGYLAPELVLGESAVDQRADIYGLGCAAYFLLTGRTVFDERDPLRVALLHVHEVPEAPSRHSPHAIPDALDRLILDCLAKAPGLRPPTVGDVAERLEACGAERWSAHDARDWWHAHLPADRRAALVADGLTPSVADAPARSASRR